MSMKHDDSCTSICQIQAWLYLNTYKVQTFEVPLAFGSNVNENLQNMFLRHTNSSFACAEPLAVYK